jgi:hypothetical protein
MEWSRPSPELVSQLALLLAAVAWACLLGQGLARRSGRRRLRLRMQRARAGEQRASQLLHKLGYRVLGEQVSGQYELAIDAQPVSIAVRADYLVERAGLRYVAEVKTGEAAPRIQSSATRRQLLEYRVAFEVDGALLVDVEAQRAQLVRFPFEPRREEPRPTARWALLFTAVVLVVVLARWVGELGAS